tara:strand:- start:198 stop:641 length:444 start_codon:yes stop_codon:yes gene_type:complete
MAKIQINFNQIDEYIEDQCNKLIRTAVIEADKMVKLATPRDTGRLVNSWQVGENQATGGYGVGPVSMAAPPIDRIGYALERIGKNYSIHTNLPYAEPVLTGNNMPKSWNNRWRSKGNQYQKNYIPVQVAKDIQGMIKVNAARIGKTT